MRPDRLLEGENPTTMFPRDARHWIGVYREMITFKDELLARVSARVSTLPPSARLDVTENDIEPLKRQLHRYQRRIEFWYARQWELEGLEIDPDTRNVTYRTRSVNLTKRELQLMVLLVRRSPGYVSPNQLLVQAWHDSKLPEETLRTYIVKLRSKIAQLGVSAEILNRPRRGYALVFHEGHEPDQHDGHSIVDLDGHAPHLPGASA